MADTNGRVETLGNEVNGAIRQREFHAEVRLSLEKIDDAAKECSLAQPQRRGDRKRTARHTDKCRHARFGKADPLPSAARVAEKKYDHQDQDDQSDGTDAPAGPHTPVNAAATAKQHEQDDYDQQGIHGHSLCKCQRHSSIETLDVNVRDTTAFLSGEKADPTTEDSYRYRPVLTFRQTN